MAHMVRLYKDRQPECPTFEGRLRGPLRSQASLKGQGVFVSGLIIGIDGGII